MSSESFVDYKLAAHHSDILIRTKMRSSAVLVYILVEHKSHPERWTVFQLLKYMVRIWEQELAQKRRKKTLDPIIPIIFYHGTRKWRFPLDFPSYFDEQDELEAYIPTFTPAMLNLQQLEDRNMQGSVFYLAALKALKYSAGGFAPHLEEVLRSLSALPFDARLRAFMGVLFEYILVVDQDDIKNIKEQVLSTGSDGAREAYMTMAEQLIEEGKTEGKILEKQNILLRLLEKKFGGALESNAKKVMSVRDTGKLDHAVDSLLDAESIDEVLQQLD